MVRLLKLLDFCCFRFEPFSRRDSRYEPLLHTRSEYGHLPYGFRYFREEFPDRRVTQQVCHESFCYQHGIVVIENNVTTDICPEKYSISLKTYNECYMGMHY